MKFGRLIEKKRIGMAAITTGATLGNSSVYPGPLGCFLFKRPSNTARVDFTFNLSERAKQALSCDHIQELMVASVKTAGLRVVEDNPVTRVQMTITVTDAMTERGEPIEGSLAVRIDITAQQRATEVQNDTIRAMQEEWSMTWICSRRAEKVQSAIAAFLQGEQLREKLRNGGLTRGDRNP